MKRAIDYAMMAGGIVLLAGAALKITGLQIATYLYVSGVLVFAAGQFMDRYDGDSIVIKRLRGQQILGSVFLILSALSMLAVRWRPQIVMDSDFGGRLRPLILAMTAPNNWIVLMCIAAVFELYSSIRIDRAQY